MSRLLESFAADEGFQMDGSSFSEEEEDSRHSYNNKSLEGKTNWISCNSVSAADSTSDVEILIVVFAFHSAVPNCFLTKELLTDGLKVLISKEDELLYAARVHTLELPDM